MAISLPPSRESATVVPAVASSVRHILDASLDAVVGMDERGRVVAWNRQATAMFGWREDQAVGRTVAELIVPARFRDAHWRGLERFLATGEGPIVGKRIEMLALHESGRELPVELRVTAVREGQRLSFWAFLTDLTARKLAEEEREVARRTMETQRRLFESILMHAPAGIALISRPNHIVEFANPAFSQFLPGRIVQGRPAIEVSPELGKEMIELFDRVFASKQPLSSHDRKLRLRAADGQLQERWFTFSFVPVQADGGEVDSLLILAVETTDEVRTRQRLDELMGIAERRAAELSGIIAQMTDAVIVCGRDARVTLANAAASNLLGAPVEELVGLTAGGLLARAPMSTLAGAAIPLDDMTLVRALRGEKTFHRDVVIGTPAWNRRPVMRSSATPIRNAQGAVVGAVEVARDVTEINRLERLQREFVRASAHELNTPVTVVTGYVQALSRYEGALPPQSRELLDAIRRGVTRIERIVRDLLYVSRIDLGRLDLSSEPIRLDELVRTILARARRSRHAPIELLRADAVTVLADREGLDQVITNLVDNARRYSPPENAVEVSLAVEGDRAVLAVRDHGAGIPPEKQPHIFERFFRAHTDTAFDYEGIGLGLHISHEIVTDLGGRMWFESAEGKGSTFFVALPVAKAKAETT